MDDTTTNTPAKGLSRRTLVAGTAWAVPVVAVGAPAAFAGASQSCTESGLCLGTVAIHKACGGCDPQKIYWACVSFTNNGPDPLTVTFDLNMQLASEGPLTLSGGGSSIASGHTACFLVKSSSYGSCPNGTWTSATINFNDGTNTGSVNLGGGSTGGSVCAPIACSC